MIKNSVRERGLNALTLKNIAVAAMIIDHLAWAFLRSYTDGNFHLFVLYEILRGIGRLTMPIMCLLLTEGYIYTRNLPKYLSRLFLFSLISHVPYVFFNYGVFGIRLYPLLEFETSIIFNLFLSLTFISVLKTEKLIFLFKIILCILCLFFSLFCDWGTFPIFAVFIFTIFRDYPIWKFTVYIFFIPVWFYIHFFLKTFISLLNKGIAFAFFNTHSHLNYQMTNTWQYRLFFIGLFAALPFLIAYNGKKGGTKNGAVSSFFSKWFFYIFYPLHLIILGIYKYGKPF